MSTEHKLIKSQLERLLKAPLFPFPEAGSLRDVPYGHGVYVIYGADKRVMHVGQSIRGKRGLLQRLGNHLRGQSSFVRDHLKSDRAVIRKGYRFRYLEVPDARTRALLEAFAIGVLCPAHMGLGARKE